MFHFSYETLNAPRERLTILCNFWHLFLVLLYEWNTNINDSFQFLGVFSQESFPGKGLYFSMGGFISKWGAPQGAASALMGGWGGGGGGPPKRVMGWEGTPHAPHYGKTCTHRWKNTLISFHRKHLTLFIITRKL